MARPGTEPARLRGERTDHSETAAGFEILLHVHLHLRILHHAYSTSMQQTNRKKQHILEGIRYRKCRQFCIWMLQSFGRDRFESQSNLYPNEIRQMTQMCLRRPDSNVGHPLKDEDIYWRRSVDVIRQVAYRALTTPLQQMSTFIADILFQS